MFGLPLIDSAIIRLVEGSGGQLLNCSNVSLLWGPLVARSCSTFSDRGNTWSWCAAGSWTAGSTAYFYGFVSLQIFHACSICPFVSISHEGWRDASTALLIPTRRPRSLHGTEISSNLSPRGTHASEWPAREPWSSNRSALKTRGTILAPLHHPLARAALLLPLKSLLKVSSFNFPFF